MRKEEEKTRRGWEEGNEKRKEKQDINEWILYIGRK